MTERILKVKKITRNVNVSIDEFKKRGEVKEYDIYEKGLSNQNQELAIDHLNWEKNNERKEILLGYRQTEEILISDVYPLRFYRTKRQSLSEFSIFWLYQWKPLVILGLALQTFFIYFSLNVIDNNNENFIFLRLLSIVVILFLSPFHAGLSAYLANKIYGMYVIKKKTFSAKDGIFPYNYITMLYAIILSTFGPVKAYTLVESGNKTGIIFLIVLVSIGTYLPFIMFLITNSISFKKVEIQKLVKKNYPQIEIVEEDTEGVVWLYSKYSKREIFEKESLGYAKLNRSIWRILLFPRAYKTSDLFLQRYIYYENHSYYKNLDDIENFSSKYKNRIVSTSISILILVISILNILLNSTSDSLSRSIVGLSIFFGVFLVMEVILRSFLIFNPKIPFNPFIDWQFVDKFAFVNDHLYFTLTNGQTYKTTETVTIEERQDNRALPKILCDKTDLHSIAVIADSMEIAIFTGYRKKDLEEKEKTKKIKEKK